MKSLMPPREHVLPILRALQTVALADQSLSQREREFISFHQKAFENNDDLEALPTIDAKELAQIISLPEERQALIQRLVILALLDEEAHPKEIEVIRSFAKAFEVNEPAVHQMELASKGHILRLSWDLVRKGFIGKQFAETWEKQGLRGLLAAFRTLRGKPVESLAAKYRALGDLPEGTLGKGYFLYMRSNQFALPGEPKGPPEMLIFHDLGHVLTGYTTDVAGEIRMAGFEAGYMGEDGFGVAALALFAFHLGIKIPNIQASTGHFDFASFEKAWQVGKRTLDLRSWDFWPLMDKPVEEARAAVGLPSV